MKTILYIGGFEMPDKNAAAQRVIANAKLLRNMGFEVTFIGISKDIDKAPNTVDGFISTPVPYPSSIKQWIYHIFRFIKITEIIKRKPDYVILYNFPSFASLRILRTCHRYGIKVVQDITEWETSKGWSLSHLIRKIDINLRMRYCIKKMDGVIAISRYLYDYYKNYTKTILVPPTVDLNNPKFLRNRELTASDNIIKLVYAGSTGLSATKDRLDFIIKEVNNLPNVKLDIVGLNKEQFFSVFGKDNIIKDNIVFHGRVSHTEAIKLVCDADFQMLIREKTLKNTAGFPTKFVESISCCTPLIATLTSNIDDYLKDGVNGLVVSDEHSLGEVLRRVVKLPASERIKMKETCRAFEGFDYHSYKKEFSEIFK